MWWQPDWVQGLLSLEDAARALGALSPGVERRVTTFPEQGAALRTARATGARSVAVQVYTGRVRLGRTVPWTGSRYSPGRYQADGLHLARLRLGRPMPLAAGLATWRQSGWVHDGRRVPAGEAMRAEYASARPAVTSVW
jgi:hypothetical protein